MQFILGFCISSMLICFVGFFIFLKTFTPEREFRTLVGFSPATDRNLVVKQYSWLLLPKLSKLAKEIEKARNVCVTSKNDLKVKPFDARSRLKLFMAEVSLEVAKLDFEKAYTLGQKFGYPLKENFHPRLYQSFLSEEDPI